MRAAFIALGGANAGLVALAGSRRPTGSTGEGEAGKIAPNANTWGVALPVLRAPRDK